ncbi:MAG TPA: hypothetical protein VMH87_11825 [Pseudomonadales bacterium]|nr:hypothetical protein [Pseudomonadales bacterium]
MPGQTITPLVEPEAGGRLVEGADPLGQAITPPVEFVPLDAPETPLPGHAIAPLVDVDFDWLVDGVPPPGQAIAPEEGGGDEMD